MGSILRIEAIGLPGPQGSKKYVGHSKKGHAILVESSGKVGPWRDAVVAAAVVAARRQGWKAPEGPIRLSVEFRLPRLKEHFGTGRNSAVLKDGAPVWHVKYPDLSKLVRSTEDALVVARVLIDDRMIAALDLSKVYCGPGDRVGASITIETIDDLR